MQGGRRPTSEQLAQQGGHRPPCTSKRVYAYTFQCVCVYVSSSVRIARDKNRWADFLEIVLLADTWEKVCASYLVPFINTLVIATGDHGQNFRLFNIIVIVLIKVDIYST